MRITSYWIGLILLVFSSSCDPEPEGGGDGDGDGNGSGPRKAVMGTEGISPGGSSALHIYDINSGTLNANAYRKENLSNFGLALSDLYFDPVSNSIIAVLAGSERIRVMDPQTLVLQETIDDIEGINKVLRVNERSIYLSSSEEEGVIVINRKWNTRKVIPTGREPEHMAVFEDLVFVANNGGELGDSTVTVIRGSADTVIAQLPVLPGPSGLAVDDENHLWVLCHGKIDRNDPTQSGAGGLFRYNLDTMQMAIDSSQSILPDTVLSFSDNQLKPNDLIIDNQGRYLYYRQYREPSNIIRMSLSAQEAAETPFLNGNFFSLAIDRADNFLYTGTVPANDPNSENGRVRIYAPGGDLRKDFVIGVKPVDFVFP